jgi:hypothetical protein
MVEGHMNWVPVVLPLDVAATAKRLAEALLEVMLTKPAEDWQRYRDGSRPVISSERDADGNLIVRWHGDQEETATRKRLGRRSYCTQGRRL